MFLLFSSLICFIRSVSNSTSVNQSWFVNGETCNQGLVWTRYFNEIEFINPAESYTVDGVNFPKFKYGYNSISVVGSFCPDKSGKYRVQATGRPYVQLEMNGVKKPATIGPAGDCWPSTHTQVSIENMYLDKNKCYRLRVDQRTGCSLYNQYLYMSFFYEDEGEWFPPKELYRTCSIDDDCIDGYYGEHCTEKCQVDCGAHGYCFNGTKGNGKCICDDNWEGEGCNKYIEPVAPALPNKGASFFAYHNEVAFSDKFYENIYDKIWLDGIGYVYCSAEFKGSIMPERTGDYKFRIHGKPYVQFHFLGTHTPNQLGPAASCNNAVFTDYESDIFHLDQHHTYPYLISYRSGCGLIYEKHIHLQWKNGAKWGSVDVAPWEEVPDFSSFVTTEDQCVPNFYGKDCSQKCSQCPSDNFECNDGIDGTGKCQCKPDSLDCFCSEESPCQNGGTCDMKSGGKCQCLPGFYGEFCQRYCDANATCHGSGYCTDQGYCFCDDQHSGENCTLKCTRRDTCNGHGDCIGGGNCKCDKDWSGNTCAHHDYQPSPNVMEKGVVFSMFNNEFFTGGYHEEPHFEKTMSRTFDRKLYKSAIMNGAIVSYNKTKVEVRMRAKPIGQIKLNLRIVPSSFGPAGSCIGSMTTESYVDEFTMFPNRLYNVYISYRTGCSLIQQSLFMEWRPRGQKEWTVIPNENLRANTWGQNCLERYYGEFCNEYCDKDCNMNGDCVMHDGKSTCKCFDSYYGDSCEFHCDPLVDCNGNGICYNNQCVCDMFHSGEHCEIECKDEINCNGHGKCSPLNHFNNNTLKSISNNNNDNKVEYNIYNNDKKNKNNKNELNAAFKCICEEGFEGETCAQIVHPTNDTITHGVNYTVYSTENYQSSTPLEGPKIIDNMTINFKPLMFNAVTLRGAIVTENRFQGRLRFYAKPYGQLYFNGNFYPEKIGPSLSCWYTTVTDEVTPETLFLPNKLYHYNFSYKSGCSFFEQYIKVEWQIAGKEEWVEVPSKNLIIPESNDQQCLKGYYGEQCNQYCSLDCKNNGQCIYDEVDKKEKCECIDGASGEFCENFCDAQISCHGNGHCNRDNFKCVCDAFHSGENCEIGCIDEINCNGHGKCSSINSNRDGSEYKCTCDDGFEGETCAQHTYKPSVNESVRGVKMTFYDNEEFDDKKISVNGTSIVTNLSQSFVPKLYYRSVKMETSLYVKSVTRGKIRFSAKPYGQLIIDGFGGDAVKVPTEIGSSNWCWGWTVTENQTAEVEFLPNRLYPLTFLFKSGCSIIEQYFKIEWLVNNNNNNNANVNEKNMNWEEIPIGNLVVPSEGKEQKCYDRYFGEKCDEYCELDCSNRGRCHIVEQQHRNNDFEGGNELDNFININIINKNRKQQKEKKCYCIEGYTGDQCQQEIITTTSSETSSSLITSSSSSSSSSTSSSVLTTSNSDSSVFSDNNNDKDGKASNKDLFTVPVIAGIVSVVGVLIIIVLVVVFLIGRKSGNFMSTIPLISQDE